MLSDIVWYFCDPQWFPHLSRLCLELELEQAFASLTATIFHTLDQKHLCNVVCEKA